MRTETKLVGLLLLTVAACVLISECPLELEKSKSASISQSSSDTKEPQVAYPKKLQISSVSINQLGLIRRTKNKIVNNFIKFWKWLY